MSKARYRIFKIDGGYAIFQLLQNPYPNFLSLYCLITDDFRVREIGFSEEHKQRIKNRLFSKNRLLINNHG